MKALIGLFLRISTFTLLMTGASVASVTYSVNENYDNGPFDINHPLDHIAFEASGSASTSDFLSDGSYVLAATGSGGGTVDGGVYGYRVSYMYLDVSDGGSLLRPGFEDVPDRLSHLRAVHDIYAAGEFRRRDIVSHHPKPAGWLQHGCCSR